MALTFISPNIWIVVVVAKKIDLESGLRQTANIRPRGIGKSMMADSRKKISL